MTQQKTTILIISDRSVAVNIRTHPRARNIILKLNEWTGEASLVLPRFVSKSEGLRFLYKKAEWLLRELDSLPARTPFEPGVTLPFLGTPYRVEHYPERYPLVRLKKSLISVFGDEGNFEQQLKNWLLAQARKEIASRVRKDANRIGVAVNRISVRELRTRWGSCGENGNLSFSWRLIFASPPIIDYVVAHEVCHLHEMNHSAKFWALVRQLCSHEKPARQWLRHHGASLHRFG